MAKNSSFGFSASAVALGKSKSAICAAGFLYETQQSNISHKDLKKIKAPILIIARDIIKNEHAVEMFNNIPKSQLCIMPKSSDWLTK